MSYDDVIPYGGDEANQTDQQQIREVALANPHGATREAVIAVEQICEQADNEEESGYSVREKVAELWRSIETPANKTLEVTVSLTQKYRAAWGGKNAGLENEATIATTNKTVAETAAIIAGTGKTIAETENTEESTKLLESQRVGQDLINVGQKLMNFGEFTKNTKEFMELMDKQGFSAEEKKQVFRQMIQQQGLTISTDNTSIAVVTKEQEPDWMPKE